ncbi:MAG: aminotransferase class I/II-fold pyridoxal phosphate-dependent enzyme [Clostridia bacterium]|nr:aminotransferase class I/II-fold pyridoxal phosphate-dependent enzyme [Clostridia bacterium]
MKTPIIDFVKQYRETGESRFHMPGHKGKALLGMEALDITEIDGADVLYSADGIINESEDLASSLFGTAHTFYSAEGSTLAIKAMLALVSQTDDGERPLILAGRNAHKAFIYGAALLGIEVAWLYPEPFTHLCRCEITAVLLEKKLSEMKRKPCAVYITSPDYLGQTADIRALADVCKRRNIPMLVDNAHGAYLHFLEESRHPIALGATMCCDSAHKTLPVLTGGAYLHISDSAPKEYLENARNMLALFASTSPSYLILQSLDRANAYLADAYPARLAACIQRVEDVKARLSKIGFAPEASEPLKIVLHASLYGHTGGDLAVHLKKHRIVPEFYDGEYLVLMITPENDPLDFERLLAAFDGLKPKKPIDLPEFSLRKGICRMSVREAMLGAQEIVPVERAVGRICAAPTVSCPPAVPIVISGEEITAEAVEIFRFYGIEKIAVVK